MEADTELREPVDACLIAVKHTSLHSALDRVPPTALGDGLVVPLLNGVEHPATLRARYRPDRVAPAVIRVESTRIAPGVIEHGSPFAELDLTGDGVPRERLDALASALAAAGPATRVLDDESAVLWAKMSFLAPFALLTTLHGLPLGEVRTRHREELTALVEETAAVSAACGGPADPAQALARYDAFPPADEVLDAARRGGGPPPRTGRDRRGVAARGGPARGEGARRDPGGGGVGGRHPLTAQPDRHAPALTRALSRRRRPSGRTASRST